RTLASIFACDGDHDRLLWFFIIVFGLSDRPKILRCSMDVARDRWDLDGKFLADLYVFQSLMVACPVGVYRCAVPLVLGPNATAANGRAMGHFGLDGGLDGKCLLSECHSADLSRAGSRSCFARETSRFRPARGPNSTIGAPRRRIYRGFFRFAFPHVYYAADHL